MITTGITTALNVDIDVKPASAIARAGAFLIDIMVIVVLYIGSFLLMAMLNDVLSMLPGEARIAVYIALSIAPIMYPMVSELLLGGQTLGKMGVGIRVVRLDGRQLGLLDVAIRWLFFLIEVLATTGSMALVVVLFSKRSQRLGDMVAGTLVVNKPAPVSLEKVLALCTTSEERRALVFPSVSRLSDADIQTIRDVVDEAGRSSIRVDARMAALWTLRDGVARRLGVDTSMGAEEFLRAVLADYAALRG